MKGLEGRVAIVTGGSRGIGKAIATKLASEGCRIILADILDDAGQALAEEMGEDTIYVHADVTKPDELSAMVDAALAAFGTVDILVNNAGIARDALMLRMSEADWDMVVNINLKGAFNCVKAVQRTMLRQRRGRIINISSVVGLCGNAGQANYAAAKAGLVGLTKTLAKELGSRNVTVNAVAPGFIQTDMTAGLPDEVLAGAKERIALGRLGKPEDVANAVAFFASDAAAYVSGTVLRVDGCMAM
jgi:3-oxoacyl-[acyl-carrier protein] reductase